MAKYNNRLERIMWLSIHIGKSLVKKKKKKGYTYFYFPTVCSYKKGLKKVLRNTSGHLWQRFNIPVAK